METKTENYNISFFKPTTVLAKRNRNLILMLVIVWAVAIFGFQILLRIIEKPTPEEALIAYNGVWDDVKSGSANIEQKTECIKSMLSVVGKGYINPEHSDILKKSISWLSYELAPVENKIAFIEQVKAFNQTRASLTSLDDENYKLQKIELKATISNYINLVPTSSEAKLLPLSLLS